MLLKINTIDLYSFLLNLGQLIAYLVLFYIAWVILSWIYRTLIIPLFERRAYFYKYSFSIWYFERLRKFLFIKLGLNKRWAIHRSLIGYVARRTFSDNQNATANDIYTVSFFGRERVGQAKFIDGVCKIILRKTNSQGDEFNNNDPVGYIDSSGKVYKYYLDRNALLKGIKLAQPVFIGQCEFPVKSKKQEYNTRGEEEDFATLPYITDERNIEITDEKNITLGDTWFSFHENHPGEKKVKTSCFKSSGAVPDGRKRFVGLGFWRYLQVYPFPWDFKKLAWGYGYCKEDFLRTPLKENDNEIRLIARAGAALLLIEKEGFLEYEDEITREEKKGLAATAIVSLCLYFIAFSSLWTAIDSGLLFPFLGGFISKIAAMIICFFMIWFSVHFLRLFFDSRPSIERFLEMTNHNTGTTGWNKWIITVSIAGLLSSFLITGYPLFALFLCTLIAFMVNRIAFKQKKWEIQDPRKGEGGTDEMENHEVDPGEDDFEIKKYSWTTNTAIKKLNNYFEIPLSKSKIKEWRLANPFRYSQIRFGSYNDTVKEMISDEFFRDDMHSYIKAAKYQLEKIAEKEHLSYIDKVHLLISFAQSPNISYEDDCKCDELMINPESIPSDLLVDDGFAEYCRYPSETLFDKRGDCECHAAITAALLAACGITSCLITGQVNDGGYHAAIGVEITPEISGFLKSNNFFYHPSGICFMYVETTSPAIIGEVPDGFEKMIHGEDTRLTVVNPFII